MKTGKKITSLLLALFFVMASLAGCGQSAPTGAKDAGKTEAAQGERTVVDMAGRTVKLPAEIKSIATFGSIGVLNAFVETLGEGGKICNEMSATFTKNDRWKYQYVFAPQLKKCPVFQDASGAVLTETVLKTKPDLCLVMTKELAGELEARGLNVLYLSWTKPEDVKTCITLLGEALNKQAAAKDYITYFDKMISKAQDLTKNIKASDKKKVLYGNITEYTQPHLIAEWWIPAAGGISVTNDGRADESKVYTMEDLLKWNPDVLIAATPAIKKDLLADSRFANVTAVKNKQIFGTPTVAHVWGNRTTEQPLMIMWTLNKLYPELETREALKQDAAYFYSHFFKTNLSDKQINEIIGQ